MEIFRVFNGLLVVFACLVSCAHSGMKNAQGTQVEELKKQLSDLQKVVTQHSAQLEILMDKNPHQEPLAKTSSVSTPALPTQIAVTEKPSGDVKTVTKDSAAEAILNDAETTSEAKDSMGLQVAKPHEKSVIDTWPEQKLFQTAYALQDSNPNQSAKLFARFIRNHPHSVLADNSLYWLGMIQFQTGAYHKAILFWDKILRDYPQSNKVPNALFQMSQGYEKLNQPEKAKIALDRLTTEHAESESAKLVTPKSESP